MQQHIGYDWFGELIILHQIKMTSVQQLKCSPQQLLFFKTNHCELVFLTLLQNMVMRHQGREFRLKYD